MSVKTLPASVPAPALLLIDFIVSIEAPRGFDTIYGNNQDKLPVPITQMTLGDIVDAQATWSKRFGSSAAGGAQFMRATLQGICREIPSLRGDMIFTADLQKRLAYYLLLRRGYEDFIAGRMAVISFGKALAQEWASFPVLADCKGAHRSVRRGQSFYAGDGLNKALVEPRRVEAKLKEVMALARADPATPTLVPLPKPETSVAPPPPGSSDEGGAGAATSPAPANVDPEKLDKPLLKSKTVWQWIATTILMPMLAVFQDWRVQLAIVVIIACFAVYAIKRRADIAKVYRDLKTELDQ